MMRNPALRDAFARVLTDPQAPEWAHTLVKHTLETANASMGGRTCAVADAPMGDSGPVAGGGADCGGEA